jgi:hypothetical protein
MTTTTKRISVETAGGLLELIQIYVVLFETLKPEESDCLMLIFNITFFKPRYIAFENSTDYSFETYAIVSQLHKF